MGSNKFSCNFKFTFAGVIKCNYYLNKISLVRPTFRGGPTLLKAKSSLPLTIINYYIMAVAYTCYTKSRCSIIMFSWSHSLHKVHYITIVIMLTLRTEVSPWRLLSSMEIAATKQCTTCLFAHNYLVCV